VIQFENDSATAELDELRARSEIIRIRAQLATFTGELQSDLFIQ